MTAVAVVLLLAQELAPLVWNAVDASPSEYPKAVLALRKHPDGGWKKVARVLEAGRLGAPTGVVAIDDQERLVKALERVRWSVGEVRTYDFGDFPGAFYRLELPRSPAKGPIPVSIDLMLPLQHPEWALVQVNWTMVALMEEKGIPMSMTAGRNFQSLVLSIVADLERRIPVDRSRVFVGGFSRGGNAAWYFGVHWPDRFAGVMPASGYYPVPDKLLGNLDHVGVFAAIGVDRGHRDSNAYTEKTARLLKRRGHPRVGMYRSTSRAVDGSIREEAWKWLLGTRGEALPKRVRYALQDEAHGSAYWIEIRRVVDGGTRRPLRILAPGGATKETVYLNSRVSWVEAEVVAANEVALKTRAVEELVLRLSPGLFDLERPIRVRRGGKTKSYDAKPSVNVLIRSYRRDRDKRRLYPAELKIRPGR